MPEHIDLDTLEHTPHAEVFETRRPRTVRLSLDEDERVPSHSHPGAYVVLVCLSGHLELSLDGEVHQVGANEVIRFSGERDVSPVAVEDSSAIIVFAPAVAETDSG